MQAKLLLEDGTVFEGKAFGAVGDSVGEVVFNTGMTGYQELLSNPSYCGQIVTMTYPLIGNYGIIRDDFESIRPFIHGIVVKRHELMPSNWRARYTLDDVLKEYGIPGISDIDTRMLTRKIRQHGAMKGLLSTSGHSIAELQEMLNASQLITDQVARVSSETAYIAPGNKERIVLVDYGVKHGIIRQLSERGCEVVVVPYDTTAEQIRKLAPDGIVLSNGPGDPKQVPGALHVIQELLGQTPMFAIGLGHQLFALACGADSEKMKFGHRGNYPVKDVRSGRSYNTSQSHGYTIKEDSISGTELEVTHINNNDGTIEGLRHKKQLAFSVQYHPEAAPGPYDTTYLFDEFLEMIRTSQADHPEMPRQSQMLAAWEKKTLQAAKGEHQHA